VAVENGLTHTTVAEATDSAATASSSPCHLRWVETVVTGARYLPPAGCTAAVDVPERFTWRVSA
jgi:hypothetical protein